MRETGVRWIGTAMPTGTKGHLAFVEHDLVLRSGRSRIDALPFWAPRHRGSFSLDPETVPAISAA